MTTDYDPHRPCYHFTAPYECGCMPFDPNGAIWWKGRYHLCYIFQRQQEIEPKTVHCWGHASSTDLIHWMQHPTALDVAPGDPDRGIFSGSAFMTRDGRPAFIYHGVGAGNCIALAQDDGLIAWSKLPCNPIVAMPKEGDAEFGLYRSWDPHAWLEGETYYAIFGGNPATLFKATDLTNWRYLRRIVDADIDRQWTDETDDLSCPDFFALGDRHMLLAISHRRGARYYLGRWEDERFTPESHHWMNWPGGRFFAPETLLDERGRRILWAWVLDPRPSLAGKPAGWPGVMCLPRILSLAEDGTLRIEPPDEFKTLRRNPRRREAFTLESGQELLIDDIQSGALELEVEIDPGAAAEVGVVVARSPDGKERTSIVFAPGAQTLKIDFSCSSQAEENGVGRWVMYRPKDEVEARQTVTEQVSPLALRPGEPLRLRIFLDCSILEVFANGRQCVTQRIFPSRPDSLGAAIFARGGAARVNSFEAWDMQAA